MATLTVRKIDDATMDTIRDMAKCHNRSAEAEVRSILEESTAEFVARKSMSNADLVHAMWRILDGNGLGPDEELVPPRDTYMRPVDLGFDAGES